MSVQEMTQFERDIIQYIINNESPEHIGHLPLLMVVKRENTGVGIYVYFEYSHEPRISDASSNTIGHQVYVDIEGLNGGAGCMLYIDEGRITMLECYSHSAESWPINIGRYDIRNL
ncbi:MAG: hypothetical protein AB7H86_07805 [Blastocatellales bacterium]